MDVDYNEDVVVLDIIVVDTIISPRCLIQPPTNIKTTIYFINLIPRV